MDWMNEREKERKEGRMNEERMNEWMNEWNGRKQVAKRTELTMYTIDVQKEENLQHLVFPGGHPSKY